MLSSGEVTPATHLHAFQVEGEGGGDGGAQGGSHGPGRGPGGGVVTDGGGTSWNTLELLSRAMRQRHIACATNFAHRPGTYLATPYPLNGWIRYRKVRAGPVGFFTSHNSENNLVSCICSGVPHPSKYSLPTCTTVGSPKGRTGCTWTRLRDESMFKH